MDKIFATHLVSRSAAYYCKRRAIQVYTNDVVYMMWVDLQQFK